MKPTFAAAIEHIMEERIRQQEAAIHLLKTEGRDTADADRRLKLLHAAFQEMQHSNRTLRTDS